MLRSVVLACVTLTVVVPLARADDEDPAIGKFKASQLLAQLKTDKNAARRSAAVSLLGIIGPKNRQIVTGVIGALHGDDSPLVRIAAAQALGKWRTDTNDPAKGAVEALAVVLKGGKEKDGAVREAAAAALGELVPQSKKVLSVLVTALKDKHAGTRAAVARTLGLLGADAELALPSLLTALQDRTLDRFTRIYSAQAVSRLDVQGFKAVPALAKVLGDKDSHPELREAAAEALGRYGKGAQSAAGDLGKALLAKENARQVLVRRAVMVALGKIGVGAKGAWAEIEEALLKDPDNSVRYAAIRLAGALGKEEPKAVTALAKASAKDENIEARLAAIEELGLLGTAAKEAVPTLKEIAARDGRISVRKAAAAALKKIPTS